MTHQGSKTRAVASAISIGLIGCAALATATGAPARGDVIQSHIHVYSDGLNMTVNVTELGDTFDQDFRVVGAGQSDPTIFVESKLENHGVSAGGDCELINDYYAACPVALGVTVRGGAKDDDINLGLSGEYAVASVVRGRGGNDGLNADFSSTPDELYGGRGNDSISGGLGRDLINGGPGTDSVDYGRVGRSQPVHVTANEGPGDDGSSEDGPPGSRDTVVNIENVYGTFDGGDYLSNGAASGILHGSGLGRAGDDTGDDRLIGGPGRDRLVGDRGDDLLVGGDGADAFLGGAGNDTLRARDQTDDSSINCGDGNDDRVVFDRGLDPRPRHCEGGAA